MSHKHDSQLQSVFRNPMSGNMHWREVESLLNHLGAVVEPAHGSRFHIVLNGEECFLHLPHQGHACDRNLIKSLREFLIRAGIKPGSNESN